MAYITVKIEDYNKLDLVARARLAVHDTDFDARTAHIEDLTLLKEKQAEALNYVNDSRALVKASALDGIYRALVALAKEGEDIAEMRNHTTLPKLRDKLAKLNFGYARAFAGLNNLIKAKKQAEGE